MASAMSEISVPITVSMLEQQDEGAGQVHVLRLQGAQQQRPGCGQAEHHGDDRAAGNQVGQLQAGAARRTG